MIVKGYAPKYGVDYLRDYSVTFSLVMKLISVDLLISVDAYRNWLLHQLDIDYAYAFIHGDLNEVCIVQPPEFIAHEKYEKVCHIRKFLYGLKPSWCFVRQV